MFDILFIIIIIIDIIFLYVIINLYKKIVIYENIIEKYNNILNNIAEYMQLTLDRLYKIDSQKILELDDEFGWFYKTLKSFLLELNKNILEVIKNDKNN